MSTPVRRFHRNMTLPSAGEILVFGSNLRGLHGAGSALVAAKHFGAVAGQYEGMTGHSYAIPTKRYNYKYSLSLPEINQGVLRFCQFTIDHPDKMFFVTAVGCGLAHYTHEEIAPMFSTAKSCSFPLAWKRYL